MGIKQLYQIIKEEAPDAVKEGEIKNQFGRKVAIVCAPYALFVVEIANFLFRMRPSPSIP